jgi:hypothetical protein
MQYSVSGIVRNAPTHQDYLTCSIWKACVPAEILIVDELGARHPLLHNAAVCSV